MPKINPQYLVDDKGMQRLEDLEDILEMDAAVKTETEFRDYQDIRADLIKEGKL
jgi:hypothetical protein